MLKQDSGEYACIAEDKARYDLGGWRGGRGGAWEGRDGTRAQMGGGGGDDKTVTKACRARRTHHNARPWA